MASMTSKAIPRSWRLGGVVGMAVASLAVVALAAPAVAADSPYKGKTIRFITQRSVHQTAFGKQLVEIGKSWGVTVDFRQVTSGQLAKKVALDYVAGADNWDLMYTGGVQRMYEWWNRGITVELNGLIKKYGDPKILEWDGFTKSARDAVSFGDKILGIAVASSDQTMAYRKDLFENAAEKAAFKAKYGYDLAPPTTYKQYYDIAKFFTRKKGEKLAGKTLERDFYGTVMPNKKGVYVWHNYENMVLAFGVDLYDPKTGKLGLTSKESLDAVSFMKSIVPFMPPSHINMANAEATALFMAGDVALYIEYFGRVVGNVSKADSPVQPGQVGFALPPSVPGNPKGYKNGFRSGPAVITISSLSKNQELAYKLLEATVNSKVQLEMARKFTGYMPTKIAAMEELAKEQPVTEYQSRVMSDPNVSAVSDAGIMPYPSILKSGEMNNIVGEAVQAALLGGDVKEEMTKAQAKLEVEFKDLKSK